MRSALRVPLRYNLRNLSVRRVTTGLTVLGIGLVVLIFESILGLAHGIERAAAATGLPENVKVLRRGATAAESSALLKETSRRIRAEAGTGSAGSAGPLATEEFLVSVTLPARDGTDAFILVRGIDAQGLAVYGNVRVIRGVAPAPGGGVVVGRDAAEQLDLETGGTVAFGRRLWKVNGIFEAGGAAYESEIWTDLDDLMVDYRRAEISSVTIRTASPAEASALAERLTGDPSLVVTAKTEPRYYEDQSQSVNQIRGVAFGLAVIMGVGAVFAGMNTMYTAVAHRTREIGTLRALGYPRGSILGSFVIEALIIAGLAGVLGSAGAVVTNTIGLKTLGVGFRQIVVHFAVSPSIIAQGFAMSLLIGALGGLLPARHAARMDVIRALRHI